MVVLSVVLCVYVSFIMCIIFWVNGRTGNLVLASPKSFTPRKQQNIKQEHTVEHKQQEQKIN